MARRSKALETQGAFGSIESRPKPEVPQRVRMARKALSEFRHDGCVAWQRIEQHANALLKEEPIENGDYIQREYLNLSGHHKGSDVAKIYVVKESERQPASATIDKRRWCGNCGRPLSKFAGQLCVTCYRLAAKEKMIEAVSMYRHWSDLYEQTAYYVVKEDNTSYLYCLTKQPDFSDRLIEEISLEEELHGVPIVFRGGSDREETAIQQQSSDGEVDYRCTDELPDPEECARYIASSRGIEQNSHSDEEQDRALQDDWNTFEGRKAA